MGWWETPHGELFVRPLDGGATVRATPQPWVLAAGSNLFVTPSADRRYVSVVAELESAPGARQVWVTDLLAPSPAPVTVFSAAQAGIPQSGKRGADGYALFTAEGRVIFKARLTGESGFPGALPDGGAGFRLISVWPDGGAPALVPQTPTGTDQLGTWGLSADGATLAYSRSSGTNAYEVYLQPVDGSSAPLRISSGTHPRWPYTNQPLVFSPDGKYLAFTANWETFSFDPWVLSTAGDLDVRLFAMPANAQAQGRMTWSPDSRQVAFRSDHLAADHDEAFRLLATQPTQQPMRVFPIGTTGERVFDLRWTRQ